MVKVKLIELEQEDQVVAVLLLEHYVVQEIQEQLTQVVAVEQEIKAADLELVVDKVVREL